jgi:DNA-binding SARP family transcriptional activator
VDRGAYEEAIDTCHKILEIDPLREEIHRTLMVCCGYLGRRSDGIRQFQSCANLLLAELGIFPLPETIEVYRSLTIAAASESIKEAEPPDRERLRKTFAEFMILGDELIELLDDSQRAKRA